MNQKYCWNFCHHPKPHPKLHPYPTRLTPTKFLSSLLVRENTQRERERQDGVSNGCKETFLLHLQTTQARRLSLLHGLFLLRSPTKSHFLRIICWWSDVLIEWICVLQSSLPDEAVYEKEKNGVSVCLLTVRRSS